MKKALITGITGQDGSYLAEFLLEKGYEVHGLLRRTSTSNTERIDHLIADNKITLHLGDMADSSSIIRVVALVQPDEIYNLAAQSHVALSFDAPEYAGDVDALGALRVLEAVRNLPCLPGFHQRTVRKGGGSATARDNAISPLQPLCCCQAVWFLDRSGIPGGLRHVCL